MFYVFIDVIFDFLFVIVFNSVLSIFYFSSFFVPFFPYNFSIFTVNCDYRGRIQIDEFKRDSLPLPLNSDW